jgi:hypothetical protein
MWAREVLRIVNTPLGSEITPPSFRMWSKELERIDKELAPKVVSLRDGGRRHKQRRFT